MPTLHELRKKLREGLAFEEAPEEENPDLLNHWWNCVLRAGVETDAYRFVVFHVGVQRSSSLAGARFTHYPLDEVVTQIMEDMGLTREVRDGHDLKSGRNIRAEVQIMALDAYRHWKEAQWLASKN